MIYSQETSCDKYLKIHLPNSYSTFKTLKNTKTRCCPWGTTLLVSRSLEQVKKLCKKALWLEKVEQRAFGDMAEVCGMHEAFLKGAYPAYLVICGIHCSLKR